MTPAEHYVEAERLLVLGLETTDDLRYSRRAQVHALLALAGATALIDGGASTVNGMPNIDYNEWIRATSPIPRRDQEEVAP